MIINRGSLHYTQKRTCLASSSALGRFLEGLPSSFRMTVSSYSMDKISNKELAKEEVIWKDTVTQSG